MANGHGEIRSPTRLLAKHFGRNHLFVGLSEIGQRTRQPSSHRRHRPATKRLSQDAGVVRR